jgi:hypothetical protein
LTFAGTRTLTASAESTGGTRPMLAAPAAAAAGAFGSE